ncbi:LLM class flavin-dependent oxidoreductase [Acrocarpospora sp. B8E8]|uniref:LLM class flavin-dependent oxidoreductase n=1 Tax=Acrocarpospora sp. B8E8 TaxID=3153572 RepID=UPI00325F6F56
MKIGVVLSVPAFAPLAEAARRAETGGLDRVWLTETPGRDALIRAVHVAAHTDRIAVGTGIAYAFTRHPIAMASAALEANAASADRITIAIGAGPAPIRSGVGASFDHPADRLAEYIHYVRTAVRADAGFSFEGAYYRSQLPTFTTRTAAVAPPKIYGSGAGKNALRAIAPVADGIALHPLAVYEPYFRSAVVPAITRQDGSRPATVAWCVTSISEHRGQAVQEARTRLAQYLSLPSFAAVLAGSRWESMLGDVQAVAVASGWAAAGRLIPEDLVDHLSVTGTPEEAAARLAGLAQRLAAAGVDEIALQIARMSGPPEAVLDDMDQIVGVASSMVTSTE